MQYPKIHLNPELTEYQKSNISKELAMEKETRIIFSIDLTENLDNVMIEPRYKEALRSVVFVTDPKTFSRIAELSDKVRQAWDSETGSIGYAQELADALVEDTAKFEAKKIDTEEIQDLTYLENAIHFAILHSFGSPLYCFSRAYGFLYLQCKIMGRSPNTTLKATFDFYEQNLPKTGVRRHSTPANAYVSSAEELFGALKKGDLDMSSLLDFLASGKFGSILKTMDSVGQHVLKDRELLMQIQALAKDLDIQSLVDETTRRLEELGEGQPSRRGGSKRRKSPSVEASNVPVALYNATKESLKYHFSCFLEQELEKDPLIGRSRWHGVFAKDSWLRCGLEQYFNDKAAGVSFRERTHNFFFGGFMSAVNLAAIEDRRESLLNIFGHYGNSVMVNLLEQYFKADEDLTAFYREREAELRAQEIARMEREPATPREPIPNPIVPPTISEMPSLAQLLKKQFGIEVPKEQPVPVVGGFPADPSQLLNNMQQIINDRVHAPENKVDAMDDLVRQQYQAVQGPTPFEHYIAARNILKGTFIDLLQKIDKTYHYLWDVAFGKNDWLRSGFSIFKERGEKGEPFSPRAELFFDGALRTAATLAENKEEREALIKIFGHDDDVPMVRALKDFFKAEDAMFENAKKKESARLEQADMLRQGIADQRQQRQVRLAEAKIAVVNAFKNVAEMVQCLLDANRAIPEIVGQVAADFGISPNLVTVYYGCGDKESRQNFFREQFHIALAAVLEVAGRSEDTRAAFLRKLGRLEELQELVRRYFSAKQSLQELEYQIFPVIEKALAPEDTARPATNYELMEMLNAERNKIRDQMVGYYNPNARYAAPAMPQMAFHNVGGAVGGPKK